MKKYFYFGCSFRFNTKPGVKKYVFNTHFLQTHTVPILTIINIIVIPSSLPYLPQPVNLMLSIAIYELRSHPVVASIVIYKIIKRSTVKLKQVQK